MKIYANNKDKSVVLFVLGKEKLEKGMHIIGSHLDAPRLDLKQYPLYEDSDFVLLKTHYYGGIKKISMGYIAFSFAWSGNKVKWKKIDIVIGEDEKDPVFL